MNNDKKKTGLKERIEQEIYSNDEEKYKDLEKVIESLTPDYDWFQTKPIFNLGSGFKPGMSPSAYSNVFGSESGDLFTISWIAILFLFVQIIINFALIIINAIGVFSPELTKFFIQNISVISFTSAGLILHVVFVNRGLVTAGIGYKNVLIGIAVGIGGALIVYLITGNTSTKLSITGIEYLLFFVTSAIAEEYLWRFGLQASIRTWLIKYNKNLAKIGSILITSLTFASFHIPVYWGNWRQIVSVGMVSIWYGFWFELDKKIDTVLVAHVLNNLISGIFIVLAVYGGFF